MWKKIDMIQNDSKLRVTITKNIREVCDVDFTKEVGIFLYEKNSNLILLSNNFDLSLPCFGTVKFDSKFRFYIPYELRQFLNITSETKFLVYSLNKHLILRML